MHPTSVQEQHEDNQCKSSMKEISVNPCCRGPPNQLPVSPQQPCCQTSQQDNPKVACSPCVTAANTPRKRMHACTSQPTPVQLCTRLHTQRCCAWDGASSSSSSTFKLCPHNAHTTAAGDIILYTHMRANTREVSGTHTWLEGLPYQLGKPLTCTHTHTAATCYVCPATPSTLTTRAGAGGFPASCMLLLCLSNINNTTPCDLWHPALGRSSGLAAPRPPAIAGEARNTAVECNTTNPIKLTRP